VQRAESALRRQSAADQKHAKAVYLLGRQEEVDELNAELQARFDELRSILLTSIDSNGRGSFDELRLTLETSHYNPPAELARSSGAPDRSAFEVPALTKLQALAPGAKSRHAADVQKSEESYEYAMRVYQEREAARKQELARGLEAFRAAEQQKRDSVSAHNAQVDQLEETFRRGDPDAVDEYMSGVLDGEFYPESFPVGYRVAYSPNSKQLVVELELPSIDAVPTEREHRFVKTKDTVSAVALPARERKALHESALAQLSIRTLSTLFEADPFDVVETIVLNGHIRSIDRRTGTDIYPCVVTVRATRDRLDELDLRRIDPIACLQGLSASISRSPSELVPVRPLLEFSMSDPRFVQESDVLSSLDTRPNLMDLSPSEFESLITNLFEKMGLETRLTQASRDGGVDCVAYDPRPIFGGKVVIQAKRYKNTVGVSAVRDLFGTMQNEGASKGILVTTSGYGRASHDFANGKPLELLDGANLLYLLKEHAEIDAKIEPPEDWVDPIQDS
jgi:restriction system protein